MKFEEGDWLEESVRSICSEPMYLIRIHPLERATEESYSISNQNLGHILEKMQKSVGQLLVIHFDNLWYAKKAKLMGIGVCNLPDIGCKSFEIVKNSLYICAELHSPDWTLECVEVQVCKFKVGQIIKVCKSLDKKWCFAVNIAHKNFHSKFFQLTSSNEVLPAMVIGKWSGKQQNLSIYISALAGHFRATRLTCYHVQFNEGYFYTYEYQEIVYKVSCAYLVSITRICVAALIIYACWITTLTRQIMKLVHLLETCSSQGWSNIVGLVLVLQLLCCRSQCDNIFNLFGQLLKFMKGDNKMGVWILRTRMISSLRTRMI